jgi:hypothetical protein
MGNKSKNQKIINAESNIRIREILSSAINFDEILASYPHLIDFSGLNINQKIDLLNIDFSKFCHLFDIKKMNAADKVLIYVSCRNKQQAAKLVTFTEEELKKLPPSSYGRLLYRDFSFARKDLFSGLSKHDQTEFFIRYPEWVFANLGKVPRLTTKLLSELAGKNPKFIDQYVSDYSNLSTDDYFWRSMINYDEKYEDIFLDNMLSCTTKTDVRRVFYAVPSLIKKFKLEHLSKSKLSCKEIILLFSTIMSSLSWVKFDSDWKFSDDLIEAFRLDSMAELLNGKSRLSKQFQNSLSIVLKDE